MARLEFSQRVENCVSMPLLVGGLGLVSIRSTEKPYSNSETTWLQIWLFLTMRVQVPIRSWRINRVVKVPIGKAYCLDGTVGLTICAESFQAKSLSGITRRLRDSTSS